MTPHVRLLVSRLVRSVCHDLLKGQEVTLQCSYRSRFIITFYLYEIMYKYVDYVYINVLRMGQKNHISPNDVGQMLEAINLIQTRLEEGSKGD